MGRDPRAGAPAPSVAEVRTYVIETEDVRLKSKENTFADASQMTSTSVGRSRSLSTRTIST